jgi:hypothetical protein
MHIPWAFRRKGVKTWVSYTYVILPVIRPVKRAVFFYQKYAFSITNQRKRGKKHEENKNFGIDRCGGDAYAVILQSVWRSCR